MSKSIHKIEAKRVSNDQMSRPNLYASLWDDSEIESSGDDEMPNGSDQIKYEIWNIIQS